MSKLRLTDRALQSLAFKPKVGRAEFFDGLCPGLCVRVTAGGTRTFSVMFRLHGQLVRRTIGRYPHVTLSQARAAALGLIRSAKDIREVSPAVLEKQTAITYGDLVEAYTEKHLKPNARSWRNIHRGLSRTVMIRFMQRPATSISRREIIDICDELVTAGTPQAAVHLLRLLKMLFNWGLARDLIAVSPCQGVKPPARPVERDRVLSDVEIESVWNATFKLPSPYGEMYQLFFLTGQRRSEVDHALE